MSYMSCANMTSSEAAPCVDATLLRSSASKEASDSSDVETCGDATTTTILDSDALDAESDLDPCNGEGGVDETVDVAAWGNVGHRVGQAIVRCSAEEEAAEDAMNINPHAWRTVGARIFQSLADLSDDE